MTDYFKKRKLRKQVKEYFQAARHARHMREDIADTKDLASLDAAEQVVRDIYESGKGDLEKAMEQLAKAADRIYPSSYRTGMRENVEVVIVALAAAMAIRAFFFQPFKIPTGSMQPTLNGINVEAQAEATLTDRQPLKFMKWLLTGTSYKEIRAKTSGSVIPVRQADGSWANAARYGDKYIINIGGVLHKVPSYLASQIVLRQNYTKGDVIVSGKVLAGDHILVNKMKYNFMNPERGDISVFDTRSIEHQQVRKDTFYIKRMIGLPNEKIQIQNRHIVANEKIVDDPPIFKKIDTDPMYHGGHDIAPGSRLNSEDAFIQLGDREYLMMGDNTLPNMSLDGRFFGGVPRADFQGPAMFVYWPFGEHWGRVH